MSKDLERSIKDRVREIAKAEGRTFNDVWKTLVLERFLARLSRSPQVENLIFKGGMLLSKYLPLGRETVDLDFLAVNLSGSAETIEEAIRSVLGVSLNDGFWFDGLVVEQLAQPHMNYPGYAIKVVAALGDTRTTISIDIGIGDSVEPVLRTIPFLAIKSKPLYEASVALRVYPPEFIFAEKLETALYRGESNSRLKDYYDLWFMLLTPELMATELLPKVVRATCDHRGTKIVALSALLQNEMIRLEREWTSFKRGLTPTSEKSPPDSLQALIQLLDDWLRKSQLIS